MCQPFNLGSIWAGWIQANSADFGAVGLGRAKALIQRVAREPEYANGSAFLYLGVFETLLPPAGAVQSWVNSILSERYKFQMSVT